MISATDYICVKRSVYPSGVIRGKKSVGEAAQKDEGNRKKTRIQLTAETPLFKLT